jgi:hypothetical protein
MNRLFPEFEAGMNRLFQEFWWRRDTRLVSCHEIDPVVSVYRSYPSSVLEGRAACRLVGSVLPYKGNMPRNRDWKPSHAYVLGDPLQTGRPIRNVVIVFVLHMVREQVMPYGFNISVHGTPSSGR